MVSAREFLSEAGQHFKADLQASGYDSIHEAVFHEPMATMKKAWRTIENEIFVPELEFTDKQAEHPKITAAGDYKQILFVDGRPREYTLHVPPDYQSMGSVPLVVMLHGHGENGSQFADMTKMSEKADKEGFIVAYPDATKWLGAKSMTAWDTNNGLVPPGIKTDDVGFVKSIIDTTKQQLPIDDRRVYLAGYSNGGMLTYLAGSQLSSDVAAIAVVSGAMSGKEPPPQSAVSVLQIHGNEDCLVPIDGRDVPRKLEQVGVPDFQPDSYANQFWARANGIDRPPSESQSGNITRINYENPQNGTQVVQETIAGGNHYWPGEPLDGSGKTATDEIWSFFETHPKSKALET